MTSNGRPSAGSAGTPPLQVHELSASDVSVRAHVSADMRGDSTRAVSTRSARLVRTWRADSVYGRRFGSVRCVRGAVSKEFPFPTKEFSNE